MIKRLGILVLALGIVACGTETSAPEDGSIRIDVSDLDTETVIARQFDEICGEGLPPCDDGLVCVRPTKEDVNFVCKVSDQNPDLTCDEGEWAMVCAERGTVKRTYQNSCYAEKAGAEILSEGKCPVAE